MDKNWDTDARAHVTYQAPLTGLHSPTSPPFLHNFTDYLMLAQSCKFGINCCFIDLTHPMACTRARVLLTFGLVHRPPPLTQFAQKGCQSTGLELRIPIIYLKFRWRGPVNFWRGGTGGSKKLGPPRTPQNLRFDPYIYQSIALDVRIPIDDFFIDLTRAVQKSKSYASCSLPKGLQNFSEINILSGP